MNRIMRPRGFPRDLWIWLNTEINGSCWLWLGGKRNGYGRINWQKGSIKSVHRVSYELLRGSVPEGLVLDHLCRNRACINPSHLEPVTQQENVLRGEGLTAHRARQSVCIRGHPLMEVKIRRRCKICMHASQKKNRKSHSTSK